MAVPSFFLSGVITGFEAVRDEAAQGVCNAGMHADRSEEHPVSATSPRAALLVARGGSDFRAGRGHAAYRVRRRRGACSDTG